MQAATRVNAEQASHDEGLVKGSHHGDIEISPVAPVSKVQAHWRRRPSSRPLRRRSLRKTTIVALARKLLVALWKYVTAGVVIEGVTMKVA